MLLIIVQASKSINRLHRLTPGSEAKRGISDVKFITAIGLCLIICAPIPYAYAKRQLFKAQMPVVAIDPGHGGKDTGAKSPNGALEKTVTLNLARMIAQQLDSDYRVVLTRNDDYALENSDRTAVANHDQQTGQRGQRQVADRIAKHQQHQRAPHVDHDLHRAHERGPGKNEQSGRRRE